jgi:hypothetical protein
MDDSSVGRNAGIGGGASIFPYVLISRYYYVSIVARALLIISGDVEVNPGPGKTVIHCTLTEAQVLQLNMFLQ